MRDSNVAQKQFSKECIIVAFIALWGLKRFNEISVTDLTLKAGVSRMAFYRNFASKEQVVKEFVEDLSRKYVIEIQRETSMRIKDFTFHFFSYVERYAWLVKKMQADGLEWILREVFEAGMDNGGLPTIEEVDLTRFRNPNLRRFVAGGLTEMVVRWTADGLQESVQQMSDDAATFIMCLIDSQTAGAGARGAQLYGTR